MSSIYFRRYTRMFLAPASKYFHKYGVLNTGYEQFMHLTNIEDPSPQNKRYMRKMAVNKDAEINDKLINNLFLKYPDLKYESVNRQKYSGDNFNSYSYAYAFITEQKKLMKGGYSMKKAFEIVEKKFQEKIKRKMDQTLLARGLAIGNRARSFLTIYQQQVEYESRLKMLRTQRQVMKYQKKLEQVKNAVEAPDAEEQEHYERMFLKITDDSFDQINQEFKDEKRKDLIDRLQKDFSNTFEQFYERAAYRDRLSGLTDEEIKQQIMVSPQKIKRQTRELMKFLKKRGDISINQKGEIRVSDGLSDKMKSFIFSSPTVKIAILNDLMSYQSPRDPINRIDFSEGLYKSKLSHLNTLGTQEEISEEDKRIMLENKLKEYQIVSDSPVPGDFRCYKLFESAEERMLRLEIKYYRSLLSNDDVAPQTFEHLKNVINKFRRLKFRMQKRYKRDAADELVFPEHYELGEWAEIEKDAEYEQLLDYLKKKVQERRLKAIDQVDDDKINVIIKHRGLPEMPQSQGDTKRT